MRLIDRLNCAHGYHKFRTAGIKCVSMGNDVVEVEQTCVYCGFVERFLTRRSTMERYMERMKMGEDDETD